MTTPDISVIVPVHNSSEYLGYCLDSILSQTYKNTEIICINDGSCDESGLVLKKYSEKNDRIKVITTECHGVGAARNCGIEAAKAPYIFFMDSDDILHRNALAEFMDIALKTKTDIVCGKYKKSKNPCSGYEKRLTGAFSLEMNPISCFGQRPSKTPITVWNKLFKKEVIGESRFLQRVFYEDTAFTLEVFSNAHSCALTPDVTYFYRTGNNSIMRSGNTEQKINDFCRVLRAVDKNFKDKPEIHRLIFSTYLNPELLALLLFRFSLCDRHLRRYMNDHIQPVIKTVNKRLQVNFPESYQANRKSFSKTRLLLRILKEKICR
ncbi:MAG: glycosyltransferase family 2 protein [Alphaproteobacteria bacterium]|nr:glycosyltransferase family 2 protein [Alphaproteobacteria bacterium]